MGMHKKVNGICASAGGTLTLYRGTILLRTVTYHMRYRRQEIMEQWKKDIAHLPSSENYYFVINPNLSV
jgi:hypothetical protein